MASLTLNPYDGSLSPALVLQIESAAEGGLPVPVNGGPIAFAMIFNAWGRGELMAGPALASNAKEWLASTPSTLEMMPDEVFARI
jgi:hypothetical protein